MTKEKTREALRLLWDAMGDLHNVKPLKKSSSRFYEANESLRKLSVLLQEELKGTKND